MLEEPSAFNTAVAALLAAQRQAIDAHSVAGGQHLCFIGSGRDEEDQYVHMVVASFLQKHHQFVSLAFGGYAALHQLIMTNTDFERFLIDHNRKHCIACKSCTSLSNNNSSNSKSGVGDVEHFTTALFDKVANAVKPKIAEMKEKLVDYVTNPNQQQVMRHVSARDKLGKRYKGSNRFTIDEDLESGEL
jgi:N-formylglutamate amidohydrolase